MLSNYNVIIVWICKPYTRRSVYIVYTVRVKISKLAGTGLNRLHSPHIKLGSATEFDRYCFHRKS